MQVGVSGGHHDTLDVHDIRLNNSNSSALTVVLRTSTGKVFYSLIITVSYLLLKQVYDSLLLLFSKYSCLQLISSNLCYSSFLVSCLLTALFS